MFLIALAVVSTLIKTLR